MRVSNKILISLVAGVSLVALGACGGSETEPTDTSTATETVSEAVESAATEVADAAGTAASDVSEAATDVTEDVTESALEEVQAAAGDTAAAAEDAATDAVEAVESAAADAADTAAGVVAAAAEGARTVSDEITAEYASLTGDAANGRRVFTRCMSCHVVQEGQNRVGPSLYGLLGREAGSIENFRYSNANANSGIVWSEPVLFAYLENPRGFLPGTNMAFPGLPAAQDRADVIAYIKEQSS